MARALGLAPAAARDRLTTAGGTRLHATGPVDGQGRPSCSLLGAQGCTVHRDRPLACRLFPLGRSLDDGRVSYHMADVHRCQSLCPEVTAQPRRRVGEWLDEQDIAGGERAHDAYGRMVCGLAGQAGQLAGPAELEAELRQRAALTPGDRAALLPRPWFELVTAPGLGELIDDPETFVLAHAERILGAIAAGFAGDELRSAVLLATVAMQLGEPLGIRAAAVAGQALRPHPDAAVA